MKVKLPIVTWLAIAAATALVVGHGASAAPETVDFGALPAGSDVTGFGAVHPALEIRGPATNHLVVLHEGEAPVAYGGGLDNVGNGCLGAGFADIGDSTFSAASKKHEYVFTFGVAIKSFSVRMVDWGDFLPFGVNASQRYSIVMKAYGASNEVLDTDEIAFTSAGAQIMGRVSNEFGNLRTSGDACTATVGQPGNYLFKVVAPAGSSIARVELHPADRPSTDPHIAFKDLSLERLDTDGDGVPDEADHCPNSDLRRFVDTGGGPSSVVNVVDGEGCSLQDLVNAAAAAARNRGQYVSAIAKLADELRKAGRISARQSAELKSGAAKRK